MADYNYKNEEVMVVFPYDEIRRKAFHFLTILYVVAYWFLPKNFVLWALGILIMLIFIIENIRLRFPYFNKWILDLLGGVHRDNETDKMSGIIWTISGSFLTMLLFNNKTVVLVSLLYLTFGDAFAALFGRLIGKHKIIRDKSYEGSLACFLICLLIGLIFLDWKIALVGAFVATAIELIPWPLNDNFWLPIISSFVLSIFLRG